MSEESILITLSTTPGGPSSFPVVLKKVMELPPPNILDGDDDTNKEKHGDGDDLGGSSDMGPSAALTPAIWDKTIPYDGENFHLEYMDLEEFLIENGIASLPGEEPTKVSPNESDSKTEESKSAPVALLPSDELDVCQKEVVTIASSDIICDVTTEVSTEKDRATPEPISPDDIEITLNYEPDPTDLVLSSVPGGELFDPRKHKFSDEDLKPQPMIKKAKKVFVPEEKKDDKYWQRRKKNNMAAKRSRDARRLKENQITVRAAFLEQENAALRTEVADLRKECGRYKNVVGRYESKYGKL
ncbi:TEF transcription factor, PAR bZIP family member a isoform X1 [Takifugu rubripes]|uniref:TEF transcription factor, PAR bZIP family member a n=1 Tax=Takifugu rubripes TaxID=31033 RepID=A0A3B5KIB2_TAKRU|nr:thyrotroph embryonic factor isoform X1 [Takifugu rubripes]